MHQYKNLLTVNKITFACNFCLQPRAIPSSGLETSPLGIPVYFVNILPQQARDQMRVKFSPVESGMCTSRGDIRRVSTMFVFEFRKWVENTYDKNAKPLITRVGQEDVAKELRKFPKFRSHSAVLANNRLPSSHVQLEVW